MSDAGLAETTVDELAGVQILMRCWGECAVGVVWRRLARPWHLVEAGPGMRDQRMFRSNLTKQDQH